MRTNIQSQLLKQVSVKLPARESILPAVLLLALGTVANAEGFRNSPPGAFNLGRAGGRIAHVDDSSAVQQNPANLMDISQAEVQLTPSIIYMSADFKSSTGQKAKTEDPWNVLPNLFASAPLMNGKMAVGLGVTVPYGIGSEWDTESSAFAPATATTPPGVLRYTSTYYAELKTININPTVAFRLSDKITIGGGLDAMWSEVTLKQFYPWAIFPGSAGLEPDGRIKGEGDGWGWGGNVGVTLQVTDRQRIAVTYRSQMDVDYSGDFHINNVTPTAAFLGATSSSDFDTKIKFPNILAVGYGIQLTDRIRLETDVEWIQFSRFKTLNIDAANNNVILPASSRSVAQDWNDTFTVGIGGDWRFADKWVMRGGFQYYDSPVPDSTFSPTIPDANQYVLTVGVGYKGKHNSFEFAYGLDFYDQRKIDNNQQPAFNGKYDITVHLFSLSYRYAF